MIPQTLRGLSTTTQAPEWLRLKKPLSLLVGRMHPLAPVSEHRPQLHVGSPTGPRGESRPVSRSSEAGLGFSPAAEALAGTFFRRKALPSAPKTRRRLQPPSGAVSARSSGERAACPGASLARRGLRPQPPLALRWLRAFLPRPPGLVWPPQNSGALGPGSGLGCGWRESGGRAGPPRRPLTLSP